MSKRFDEFHGTYFIRIYHSYRMGDYLEQRKKVNVKKVKKSLGRDFGVRYDEKCGWGIQLTFEIVDFLSKSAIHIRRPRFPIRLENFGPTRFLTFIRERQSKKKVALFSRKVLWKGPSRFGLNAFAARDTIPWFLCIFKRAFRATLSNTAKITIVDFSNSNWT